MRHTANTKALGLALAIGIGVSAGAAIAVLPPVPRSVLLASTALLLGLLGARGMLAPLHANISLPDRAQSDDRGLRLPRLLYTLGAATIGLLTIRPALAFTVSDWVFLLAFLLTCAALLGARMDADYLVTGAVTIGVVLFSVGGLLSSIGADSPMQSAAVVARLIYLTLVWFWLGTILLRTRGQIEAVLFAWVCSAAFSSGGAIVQYFAGNVIPGGAVSYGRATGFTPQFNSLGGLAATAFTPALMLAVDGSGRVKRLVGTTSMVLIGAGLLLSGSVGGLLAAFLGTLLWFFLRGVTIRTVVILTAMVGAGFVLSSATGNTNAPSPLKRIASVTASGVPAAHGGSIHSRVDVYRQAWARIDEQPLVGAGLDDATSARILGPTPVHNIFINPWFSAGVLGLLGILFLLCGIFAAGARALRVTGPPDRTVVAALFASFVAFVIFAMGEPVLYVRYGWFPAALLLALRAQRARADSQVRTASVMRAAKLGRIGAAET